MQIKDNKIYKGLENIDLFVQKFITMISPLNDYCAADKIKTMKYDTVLYNFKLVRLLQYKSLE